MARGPNAKQTLENHWDTWITDADWVWLAQHGINTVRIPVSFSIQTSYMNLILDGLQIGFYHVCGVDPSVLQGSDFAPFRHAFEGAWSKTMGAIDAASCHGIGVLIGS